MGDARKPKPSDPFDHRELAPLAAADVAPVPISIDDVDDVETGEHRSATAGPPAEAAAAPSPDDELSLGDELSFGDVGDDAAADAVPRPIAPESRRDGPRSRSNTLDDPFTTGLLAEVSRRTRPIEIAADAIRDAEAGDDEAAERTDPDDREDHLADRERSRRSRP